MENEFECEMLNNELVDHDLSFKLVVIGNAGVGKSSLTIQAIHNIYDENYKTTIGFEFSSINYKIDRKIVKLQIWDTCGQEIYRSIVANFYRSSSLALLVYSIDNKDSFIKIKSWLTELRHFSSPDIKIFLVGNKSDLEETRQVSYEEGVAFQKEHNIDFFIETSAKMGKNTSEIFERAVKLLYKEYLKYKKLYNSSNQDKSLLYSSIDTKSCNSFKLNRRTKSAKESTDADSTDKKTEAGCSC